VNQKWACHISNGPIDNSDLERMLACGFGSAVLLHYQANYLPRLREALPGGILLCRYYDKDFLSKVPASYAKAVAEEAERWRPYTVDWVMANELNLPGESGGDHWPYAVVDWAVNSAYYLKQRCPWVRVHMPAFAPVNNWWEYQTIIASWGYVFDVIDYHAYGELTEMIAISQAVASIFPGKPLFCSEFNGPGSKAFWPWVQSQTQIEAAAYFIWHWENPDQAWDRDLRGSELEAWVKEQPKGDG
jgi:hypothetical protein